MCGRASLTIPIMNTTSRNNSIQSLAGVNVISQNNIERIKSFRQSKNITPGNVLPIIYTNKSNKIDINMMNWGISNALGLINPNAKIETVEETGFKRLLKYNRCVVIIDGFYEFKPVLKNEKDPFFFYIEKADNDKNEKFEDRIMPMKLACLYTEIDNKLSFTILTYAAGQSMKFCNDRQPVILTDEQMREWLNLQNTDISKILKNLKTDQQLVDFKSHQCINKVRNGSYQNDDANLPLKSSIKPISNYFTKSPIKSTVDVVATPPKSTIKLSAVLDDDIIHTNNDKSGKNNHNDKSSETKIRSIISLIDEPDTIGSVNKEISSLPTSPASTSTMKSCPLCSLSFSNFSSYDIKRHGIFCRGGSSEKKRKATSSESNDSNKSSKKAKISNKCNNSLLNFFNK